MICQPCRNPVVVPNAVQHSACKGCDCQHKIDRPFESKYQLPASPLVIEEVPSDA